MGAQTALKAAKDANNEADAKAAQDELNALILFKSDMGAFIRLYTFLSQIFDYGNTDIEKRAIFFRRLLPLLEFGREREGIDLSKVVLTHHNLKNKGRQPMPIPSFDKMLRPILDLAARVWNRYSLHSSSSISRWRQAVDQCSTNHPAARSE